MKTSSVTEEAKWTDRDPAPLAKVEALVALDLEKPDLATTAAFAEDFGFAVHARTEERLALRGVTASVPCLRVRRGPRSRFAGLAFRAAAAADVHRLGSESGAAVVELPGGGVAVSLSDPDGVAIEVFAGVPELPALGAQSPLPLNFGGALARSNAAQRPAREPARVERLGHAVLETPTFRRTLAWYQRHLGLIVSDFLVVDGQAERGPAMAFLRCDRGPVPTDHHTLALLLGPSRQLVHSAYQVADLDALAAGGEWLRTRGHRHAWGIGRHIEGSQIFDYWRDPEGMMFEHYTDGDVFDASRPAGVSPMRASGLSQWGPKVTADFLGTRPSLAKVRDVFRALREEGSELDVARLRGILRGLAS